MRIDYILRVTLVLGATLQIIQSMVTLLKQCCIMGSFIFKCGVHLRNRRSNNLINKELCIYSENVLY